MVISQGIPHRPPQMCVEFLMMFPFFFGIFLKLLSLAALTACTSLSACHVESARRLAAIFSRPPPPTLGTTPPIVPALKASLAHVTPHPGRHIPASPPCPTPTIDLNGAIGGAALYARPSCLLPRRQHPPWPPPSSSVSGISACALDGAFPSALPIVPLPRSACRPLRFIPGASFPGASTILHDSTPRRPLRCFYASSGERCSPGLFWRCRWSVWWHRFPSLLVIPPL